MTEKTTAATDQIGFIGLGDQGGPMARAVAEAGHPLHVWARHAASLEAVEGTSHTVHDTSARLAEACDVVCLCLPEDKDVSSLVLEGGLLAAMKSGSVLVNHGTGLPGFAEELAGRCAERGVDVLDAPVSGARAGALAKTLTTVVGGAAGTVRRCRAVFESFSSEVIHLGPTGAGQFGKLFNNTLMMMNHRNAVEVFATARELGLDLTGLDEVLRSASASSAALLAVGNAITQDNVAHLTRLELIDMELFAAAIAARGVKADEVVARAVAGAEGLTGLVGTVAGPPAEG